MAANKAAYNVASYFSIQLQRCTLHEVTLDTVQLDACIQARVTHQEVHGCSCTL